MRLYLAGPYAARSLLLEMKVQIEDAGHTVTSSWLQGTREITPGVVGACPDADDTTVTRHATGDFGDVASAEGLLMVTAAYVEKFTPGLPPEWLTTGGRHVEAGYALAQGRRVFNLGEPENVFMRSFATSYPTLEAFLEMNQ